MLHKKQNSYHSAEGFKCVHNTNIFIIEVNSCVSGKTFSYALVAVHTVLISLRAVSPGGRSILNQLMGL